MASPAHHDSENDTAHGHARQNCFPMSRKTRLRAIIVISFCFFVVEISVGFYTKSLALIADAFHYLNDLISFVIALVAAHVTESKTPPQSLSFGWARAQLLGAFFNGAFLLALGLSIALQSIERFISIEPVQSPKLVLIVGCVGLGLNLLSAAVLHEHGHGHGHGNNASHRPTSISDAEWTLTSTAPSNLPHATHMHTHKHTHRPLSPPRADYGLLSVLLHILGDALNNVGVIISALIIQHTASPSRFYADPAAGLFIALIILLSAVPLTKRSGAILLQSAPRGMQIRDVRRDVESIPGVRGVHELHVWRLDQRRVVASVHVVFEEREGRRFMEVASVVVECLHAYGIHSVTLQPEFVGGAEEGRDDSSGGVGSIAEREGTEKCRVLCGVRCEELKCCA